MSRAWALLARSLAVSVLLGMAGGCTSGTAAAGASLQGVDSFGGPLTRSISAVHPGQMDVKNRYLPAVGVRTPSKRADGQSDCSGVLISPRVVVTAGHCVCHKRKIDTADTERVAKSVGRAFLSRPDAEKSAVLKEVLGEATTVIDSTDCSGLSIISVTTYPQASARRGTRDGADLSYSVREYKGEVLPHDELMILYDENGWTVFKEVDLAVIVLKKPVQGVAQNVRLTRTEAQSGDVVVMVGYGLGDDDENAKTYGDRYVGESQIVKVAPSESGNLQFLTGGQTRDGETAASVYGGDSGAPCLRKTGELIGIASAYMEDESGEKLSIFTSIYSHRAWLRKVVAEAR